MSVPTEGETYAKLLEYLIKCEEQSAIMAHLNNANDQRNRAIQWLGISEMFKKMQIKVTHLATGRLS